MRYYTVAVVVTLFIAWAVWPLRPDLSDSGFEDECVTAKAGDVAELADGSGLICIKGRKVVLRENPLPKTRKARKR